MHLAYRLYLGARNTTRGRFSAHDRAQVARILDEYFQGWTTSRATGSWGGRAEQTLILTVSSRGLRAEGLTPLVAIEACAAHLKDFLGQEAVMIEEGGPTRFF